MPNTELATTETVEINPPQQNKRFLCRHIFTDGRRCGSPALRAQNFCYYHQVHRTPVLANQRRRQPASGFDLTRLDSLDNHAAIQLSLSEVLGRIANNTIDPRRAWLLLYGLQIAGHNLKHAHPTPEAPIPDTIIEDAAHGQLAQLEEGRPQPQSLHAHMQALLSEDPTADLAMHEVQT